MIMDGTYDDEIGAAGMEPPTEAFEFSMLDALPVGSAGTL
jgi:hypothetical protein